MDSFRVLPDDVLVHILSFLEIKDSVRTSILAKRWRFLWARFSNLVFLSNDYNPGTRARLLSIINKVLLLHRGYNLEHFCLSYNEKDGIISNPELETLVAALIACNVREVFLHIACAVKLPGNLFTCKTLVELELMPSRGIPHDIRGTSTFYLPALKILSIGNVYYENDKSLSHLLCGCPVLEELNIVTGFRFMVPSYISSPTVKLLRLYFTDEGEAEAMRHQKCFSIGTLPSLTETDIDIFCRWEPIGGDIPSFHYVVKLVGKVCDVKCLTLSTCLMMGVPDSAFSALTIKFPNLTKLLLDADWRFVAKFLEISDNLRDLTIRIRGRENWVEPDKVAACLVSRVGIVKFELFGCTKEQEFKMIRYILRNAKVLKRMTIHMNGYGHKSDDTEFEAVEKIQSFERGSEACEIFFDFVEKNRLLTDCLL